MRMRGGGIRTVLFIRMYYDIVRWRHIIKFTVHFSERATIFSENATLESQIINNIIITIYRLDILRILDT